LSAVRQYGVLMSDVMPESAAVSVPEPAGAALPGLDLAAVLSWLSTHAPGAIGPSPRAQLIAGGRSNLTYLLDDGERRLVVRRPPLGHVLATAHDMAREHRIIGALAGTPVPVPRAIALCTEAEVNGAPFYAMSFVDGLVVRADQAGLDQGARDQLSASMMAVLADLHEVDVDAAGLAGFGRPDGFLERQLRRWSKQLEASRSRELPGIDRLRDALAADLPLSERSGIVHGDYRLDNLVVAPPAAADALRVRAVLDWEMATLGDPLTDLGLLLAYWDVVSALGSPGVSNVGSGQGYPDGATLINWYARRRDVDLSRLPWYTAFGLFKLAVILEGIHYRYELGQTVGDDFARIGDAVPALVGAALDLLP
jgi:aminoglycoside phosphotransferase (APT) family kinase protein